MLLFLLQVHHGLVDEVTRALHLHDLRHRPLGVEHTRVVLVLSEVLDDKN